MITDKKELQRKVRRLRLEKTNLTAEISVFETVGKDKFPFSYNALKTRIGMIDGMIEGIKWAINTKSKEAKVEKKVAKPALAKEAPVKKTAGANVKKPVVKATMEVTK